MKRERADIVILGGGISGLSAAYEIESKCQNAEHSPRVLVLEQEKSFGGKLYSFEEDGFVVEGSADSLFLKKPWAIELALDLGLESEIVTPTQRGFALLLEGKLWKVPDGFFSGGYRAAKALSKSSFLSLPGKLRAAFGTLCRPELDEDVSLQKYLDLRWGKELSRKLLCPLFAGVHGGNAQELSARALYPNFFTKESDHAEENFAKRFRSPFVAFQGGMSTLVSKLCDCLTKTHLCSSSRVLSLKKTGQTFLVTFENEQGERTEVETFSVLSALEGKAFSGLAADSFPELSKPFSQIGSSGNLVITFAYRSENISYPFPASGFIAADRESSLLACSFSSRKWPGRAPEGYELLRLFLKDEEGKNAFDLARQELASLLGVKAEPEKHWQVDWREGLPQYSCGHLARVREIESALETIPGLELCGPSIRGLSVADSVREGREAARRVLSYVENLEIDLPAMKVAQ